MSHLVYIVPICHCVKLDDYYYHNHIILSIFLAVIEKKAAVLFFCERIQTLPTELHVFTFSAGLLIRIVKIKQSA